MHGGDKKLLKCRFPASSDECNLILFDANLFIALGDHDHEHHDLAVAFHARVTEDGWVTCPLTENAFLRIIGHPNYPEGPGSPDAARDLLHELTSQRGHEFWADSISLRYKSDFLVLPSSKHLTDFYLLALAVQNRGSLATFDRRIDPTLIKGGVSAYNVIRK